MRRVSVGALTWGVTLVLVTAARAARFSTTVKLIRLRAAPGNTRSRAIPLRLGFTEEDTLREAERIGDRYLDSVVYSVLAAEWGTTTALPSN